MPSDVFVLVPSYNHAPYIATCLRSIIEQTLAPRKLLVIDDGSADGSPKIIEDVLKECPFDAELIIRENRGLCRTLNEGFSKSDTTYFAYLGSDDYWLPDFLRARVHLLNSRPDAVLGYGHAFIVDADDRATDSTVNYPETWAYYPDGDARAMLLAGGAPISSTVVYRRSALSEVSWNESARLEDYEMYLKLMNRGEFAFDPTVLSAWRSHAHNTSNARSMMLSELLAAQERAGAEGALSREELRESQQQTQFLYARIALQDGDKMNAMRLARKYWRGARSPRQLGSFILRMLTPMFIVDTKRRLRKGRQV